MQINIERADITQASVAEDNPIIPSNIYLTMAMGVMLGLGDGGFCVSIYAALSKFFVQNFGREGFVKYDTIRTQKELKISSAEPIGM